MAIPTTLAPWNQNTQQPGEQHFMQRGVNEAQARLADITKDQTMPDKINKKRGQEKKTETL